MDIHVAAHYRRSDIVAKLEEYLVDEVTICLPGSIFKPEVTLSLLNVVFIEIIDSIVSVGQKARLPGRSF
jgi:hypothetical protein